MKKLVRILLTLSLAAPAFSATATSKTAKCKDISSVRNVIATVEDNMKELIRLYEDGFVDMSQVCDEGQVLLNLARLANETDDSLKEIRCSDTLTSAEKASVHFMIFALANATADEECKKNQNF